MHDLRFGGQDSMEKQQCMAGEMRVSGNEERPSRQDRQVANVPRCPASRPAWNVAGDSLELLMAPCESSVSPCWHTSVPCAADVCLPEDRLPRPGEERDRLAVPGCANLLRSQSCRV